MSHLYRLVVVGSGGVGKSCLTIQYVANRFMPDYDPTLEDSYRKQVTINDTECVLDIIDTAGQDDFMAIRESYYKEGDGFLCVFDLTARTTFSDVEGFHESILRVKDADSVPFILIGNKCDLEDKRVITKKEAQDKAKSLNCKYLETSAKLRQNVDEIFAELVIITMEARGANRQQAAGGGREREPKAKRKCVLF
ncbi:Ras-related protein Rap-1A [Balamuthia mandrillaris]